MRIKRTEIVALAAKFEKRLQNVLKDASKGRHVSDDKFWFIPVEAIANLITYTKLIRDKKFNDAARFQQEMHDVMRKVIPEELSYLIDKFGPSEDKERLN